MLMMIGSFNTQGGRLPFKVFSELIPPWKKFVSVDKSKENYYGAFTCMAYMGMEIYR